MHFRHQPFEFSDALLQWVDLGDARFERIILGFQFLDGLNGEQWQLV